MIRAGKYTVEDSGFTVTTERIGGLPRQAVVVELPGGITGTALDALCAGPIEVLNEKGEVVQTHTGPFHIATHGLKLVREDQSGDVAALASQVATLEAALAKETSERKRPGRACKPQRQAHHAPGTANSVQSADKAQGPEAADGTSSL